MRRCSAGRCLETTDVKKPLYFHSRPKDAGQTDGKHYAEQNNVSGLWILRRALLSIWGLVSLSQFGFLRRVSIR